MSFRDFCEANRMSRKREIVKMMGEKKMVYPYNARGMGAPSDFLAIFSKGDIFCSFLFAFLNDKTLTKWDLLLKKRICSNRPKFFKS